MEYTHLHRLPYELLVKISEYSYPDDVITLGNIFPDLCNDVGLWAKLGTRDLDYPTVKFRRLSGYPPDNYYLIKELSEYPSMNLTNAVKEADLKAVNILLNYVSPNPSQLILAVKRGHIKIVSRLLKDSRLNPSTLYQDTTALIEAIREGHYEIVKLLLKCKKVNPSLECRRSHLWISISTGDIKMVDLLLKSPKIIINGGDLAYSIGKSPDIFNRLMHDDRVDPSADHNSAIICASECGNLNAVSRLLEDKRVNPAARDNLAIHIAALRGHYEIVKRLLVDHRVDPSSMNNRALKAAINKRDDLINDYCKVMMRKYSNIIDLLLSDSRVSTTWNE